MSEVEDTVASVADSISVPIIVDADTGFGNPINMVRTLRVLERAGAAGIQIEDQVFPKKCGHFAGKEVIPLHDMVQKIHAAVDARKDGDLQIIARTDARAVEGFERAIERANAFIAAGADVTFVEAPLSLVELEAFRAKFPFRKSPTSSSAARRRIRDGRSLRNSDFQSFFTPMPRYKPHSRRATTCCGRSAAMDRLPVSDRLASFEERQRVVAKDVWDQLKSRYRAEA